LEQVKPLKYLGSIVNGNNSIEEEIEERTVLGNKAYYANQALFKLLSKNSKLKTYWIGDASCNVRMRNIGPKIIHKTKSVLFERKILRRIFGPTKERDGTWRIKTNDDLNKLITNITIINYIKSQRLGWFGHLYRMPDERMVKKVY
jgi:hypothetical protein